MNDKYCRFKDEHVVIVDKDIQPAYCDRRTSNCAILQTKKMMNDYKNDKLNSGDSTEKYIKTTNIKCNITQNGLDGQVTDVPDYNTYDIAYASIDATSYYKEFDLKQLDNRKLKNKADQHFTNISKRFSVIPENLRSRATTIEDAYDMILNSENNTNSNKNYNTNMHLVMEDVDVIDPNNALLYTAIAIMSIFAFLALVFAIYQAIYKRSI
jgi:hypothetical protein